LATITPGGTQYYFSHAERKRFSTITTKSEEKRKKSQRRTAVILHATKITSKKAARFPNIYCHASF
jgi:hypothetical protein